MDALIVSPSIAPGSGGLAESLIGYLTALATHGIATRVLAPDSGPRDRESFQLQAPETRLELVRAPGTMARGVALAIAGRLTRIARPTTVVHVFGLLNPVSTLAATVALRHRQPLIVCPLGMLSPYTYRHRRTMAKAIYFRLLEYPHLRRAHAVHFQSEPERVEAAWHGLPTGPRDYVIPPPARLADEGAPLGGWGPATSEPLVLFLARLDPKKNLELLLDAWPMIRARVPAARLAIAGDGEPRYVRTLQARAEAIGNGRAITFHGLVTGAEKERLLRSARVLVLPSMHENFGIVVLEAISVGVPVVISRDVQLAGVVEQHGLGVVSGRSAAELAAAVAGVLTNPPLAQHVRATGASVAHSLFSARAIGARLADMYRGALARLDAPLPPDDGLAARLVS